MKWTHRGVEITLTNDGLFSWYKPSTNSTVLRVSLRQVRNEIDFELMVKNKSLPAVCWDDSHDMPKLAMLTKLQDINDPLNDDSFQTPYLYRVGDLEEVVAICAEYEAFFAKMEERRQEFLRDHKIITRESFYEEYETKGETI